MLTLISRFPEPINEPVLGYLPGSPERARLKEALVTMAGQETEIPLFIGGRAVHTGETAGVRAPHRHRHSLGTCHLGGRGHAEAAIAAALRAQGPWGELPWEERAAVFLRAADLLAGPWRARINAATMLGQSKTCHQAEIDAACEMADFFRWNVYFLRRLMETEQPVSPRETWNRVDLRPLEGFVLAVSPFNFTSIAANLPCAPALMGNVVLWKPAQTAVLSNWLVMRLLHEAGLPDGVINFVPGHAEEIGAAALQHPLLAGIHFTGSTGVFRHLWSSVAERIGSYRGFPRLVGETGGKDFILAHESADEDALVTAIVRGGFEYQGQKCSAASRVYVPAGLWGRIKDRLVAQVESLRIGDVSDFRTFVGAVIDDRAFGKISGYVRAARELPGGRVLCGGEADDREGYFIRPTLVLAEDPAHRLLQEEIFGPVVTIHVYPDGGFDDALRLVDRTSPYALTGAVFARDRLAIDKASRALRQAAGNFYVNDKPTGAVVGQQPFGGARASGTNDKAGSALNLLRWTSYRTLKENFNPPTDYRYGFMSEP